MAKIVDFFKMIRVCKKYIDLPETKIAMNLTPKQPYSLIVTPNKRHTEDIIWGLCSDENIVKGKRHNITGIKQMKGKDLNNFIFALNRIAQQYKDDEVWIFNKPNGILIETPDFNLSFET